MPNRDAKRTKKDVGVGEALGRRKGRGGGRLRREALGQAVDLGDVEHGVGFQEPHLTAAVVLPFRPALSRVAHRGCAEVDHGTPTLPLAHLGPEGLRLAIGDPGGGGVSSRDRLHPEQEDVDPLVGLPRGAQGPHDAPAQVLGAPRPSPGPHPLLQLLQDAPGDARVGVGDGRFDLGHGLLSQSAQRVCRA